MEASWNQHLVHVVRAVPFRLSCSSSQYYCPPAGSGYITVIKHPLGRYVKQPSCG